MKFPILLLVVCFSISEGSQKKDTPLGKDSSVVGEATEIPTPQKSNIKSNFTSGNHSTITLTTTSKQGSQDMESSSSESKPKVVRHLDDTLFKRLKMGMKIPWFSSKFSDKQPTIRILKAVHAKTGDDLKPTGELIRYAPRSLDTFGLGAMMNYNNLENIYGNPHLVSGNPNSLDHLYLPEFPAKDYSKSLDLNNLGNLHQQEINNPNGSPYNDAFSNGNGVKPQHNFRGNPVDPNFHQDERHGLDVQGGPRKPDLPIDRPQKIPGNVRRPSSFVSHHNRKYSPGRGKPQTDLHKEGHPPFPEFHENGPYLPKDELENPDGARPSQEHQNDQPLSDGPPRFSEEVQGDEGLWGILDLAQLLQSANGLNSQLGGSNPDHFDARSPDKDQFRIHPSSHKAGNDGRHGHNIDSPHHNHGQGFYEGPGNEGGRGSSNQLDYNGPLTTRRPHSQYHSLRQENERGVNGRFQSSRPHAGSQSGPHTEGPGHSKGHHGHTSTKGETDYPGPIGDPGAEHFGAQGPSKNNGGGNNVGNDYYGEEGFRPNNDNQYNEHANYLNKGEDYPYRHSEIQGPGSGQRDKFSHSHHQGEPDNQDRVNSSRNHSQNRPHGNNNRQPSGNEFDDEGGYYNSNEQFDDNKRPHYNDQSQGIEGESGGDGFYDDS